MNTKETKDNWLYIISPRHSVLDLNLKEIWRYRDLLFLFVKRNVITVYKQTILGPLWYFVQPLFTSVIFTLIFNNLANIPTGNGVPAFLFNLAGITSWSYFKESLTGTSDTFNQNQSIFGKVYFPRVIVPISTVITNLVKFGIQLIVFIGFYLYYMFFANDEFVVAPKKTIVFLPVLIFLMGIFGLGLGMIVSSMTTKYRDLKFLVAFGVQLLMYGSAVMYPLSYFKEKLPDISWIVEYNPMTTIIETFRYMTLGVGEFSISSIVYASVICIATFLLGLIIFNKTEKSFIDTI